MKLEKVKSLFHLSGKGLRLEGGQNTSLLFDDKVLKPYHDYGTDYTSLFDFLYTIKNDKYRISKPIKSINGNYIEDGFIVTTYEKGKHDDKRVLEQLEICRLFHEDLKEYPITDFVTAKDPWSKAMYTIFYDHSYVKHIDPKEYAFIKPLLEELKFDKETYQIIHGDFGGNVLFDNELPPLIIDFSPNIAPKEMAEAIMICDLIAWSDNDVKIVHLLDPLGHYLIYIKAAICFRLLSISFNKQCDFIRFTEEYKQYNKILNYINEQLKTNNK